MALLYLSIKVGKKEIILFLFQFLTLPRLKCQKPVAAQPQRAPKCTKIEIIFSNYKLCRDQAHQYLRQLKLLLKLGFQKPFSKPCLHFIQQFMRSLLMQLIKALPLALRAIKQRLFQGSWSFYRVLSAWPQPFPCPGSAAAVAVLWAPKSHRQGSAHPLPPLLECLLADLHTACAGGV